VKANLEFMKQSYGSNLVAFTLHQDEKTPHIHAIVVPITPDNRLLAKEQGKVLAQRLTTSESLKQANFEKAQKTGEELTTTTRKIDQIAVLLDEKRLNPKWSEGRADHLRSKVLPKMEADILECLKERLTDDNDFNPRLEKKGYKIQKDAKGTLYLTDSKTEVRLNLVTAQIKGEFLSELVHEAVQRGIKEAQQEKQKKAQKPEVKREQGRGYKPGR